MTFSLLTKVLFPSASNKHAKSRIIAVICKDTLRVFVDALHLLNWLNGEELLEACNFQEAKNSFLGGLRKLISPKAHVFAMIDGSQFLCRPSIR